MKRQDWYDEKYQNMLTKKNWKRQKWIKPNEQEYELKNQKGEVEHVTTYTKLITVRYIVSKKNVSENYVDFKNIWIES